MRWPGPKLGIPESVRDLDHDRVVAVLVATNVNISAAARRLHVPSSDLRRLMNANPDLLALAAEKEERRLDKAEEILDRELNSDDPRYSAAAAFFVLRNARRAVARGWRQADVEITVDNPAPARTFVFKWEGDEVDPGATTIERDGKSIPVPRYDDRRGDDCLAGEVAAPARLIEHEPEHEPEPSLPVWPGPGLPPPLVANLYAPYSPPPLPQMIAGGHREEPPSLRPAVLRRRLRSVE
jgi:hypothetical protein